MFRFFMIVVLVLVSTVASAQQLPTQDEINGAYEFCNTRFAGSESVKILARDACKRSVDVKVLQRKLEAGEEGAAKKLNEVQAQLKQMQTQLAKAEQERKSETPTTSPTPITPSPPTPPPTPSTPQYPSLPAFVGGVQFGVMDTPGQFAATTWNVLGIDLLWIQDLHGGIDRFLDGTQQVRIVVRKNGVVVPIAHQGDVPFNEFYADLNNDGKPDARPYKGVDPSVINDIYVSDVRPSDNIEVVYLVRTRKLVTIAGIPPQILWGSPTRVKMDATRFVGRRVMSASTAMVLR